MDNKIKVEVTPMYKSEGLKKNDRFNEQLSNFNEMLEEFKRHSIEKYGSEDNAKFELHMKIKESIKEAGDPKENLLKAWSVLKLNLDTAFCDYILMMYLEENRYDDLDDFGKAAFIFVTEYTIEQTYPEGLTSRDFIPAVIGDYARRLDRFMNKHDDIDITCDLYFDTLKEYVEDSFIRLDMPDGLLEDMLKSIESSRKINKKIAPLKDLLKEILGDK